MKIIDERGRLFGLINILDLAVLLALVVAVYLGISTYVALSQPPLQPTGFSPEEVAQSESVELVVRVENSRRIDSAILRLIPEGFRGKTVQVQSPRPKVKRREIDFRVNGSSLQAGQYRLELETVVTDVLGRSTRQVTSLGKKLLTVSGDTFEGFVERDLHTYTGESLWRLSFGVTVPTETVNDSLWPGVGDSLSVDEERFRAGIRSVRDAGNGLSMVNLYMRRPYPELADFLLRLKEELHLFDEFISAEGKLSGGTTCYADLIFYPESESAQSVLEAGAEVASADGERMGVVEQVFGRVDNPWATVSGIPDRDWKGGSFSVVRIAFDSEVKDGELVSSGRSLYPDLLLELNVDGETIDAGILSGNQASIMTEFNVYVESFPYRIMPLLEPGMPVTGQGGAELGRIEAVLAVQGIDRPEVTAFESVRGSFGGFRRVLLRIGLNCLLVDGRLTCGGQNLGFGNRLNLSYLGTELSGTIVYGNHLPERSRFEWMEVELVFRNLTPEQAELVGPGMEEKSEDGPSTIKIMEKTTVSPSKVTFSTNAQGDLQIADHPLNRDVVCRAEMLVSRRGEFVMYRGEPLVVGRSIAFSNSRISINAGVVDF